MIAALEFQDLVALLVGARQPHGVGVRFGAGAHETHLLGARHRIDDLGRKLDAIGIVGEERGALRGDLLDDLNDLGMRMAHDHGTRAEQVVDVLVAADIPGVAAAAFRNNQMVRNVAEPTSGQNALRRRSKIALGLRAFLL